MRLLLPLVLGAQLKLCFLPLRLLQAEAPPVLTHGIGESEQIQGRRDGGCPDRRPKGPEPRMGVPRWVGEGAALQGSCPSGMNTHCRLAGVSWPCRWWSCGPLLGEAHSVDPRKDIPAGSSHRFTDQAHSCSHSQMWQRTPASVCSHHEPGVHLHTHTHSHSHCSQLACKESHSSGPWESQAA